VFNILLQVLDEGRLTDNKGRVANFKNTIIIMTTNIGSTLIQERFENLDEKNVEEVVESTRAAVLDILKKSVRPEFLNRVDETIMFRPLSRTDLRKIVSIQFELIRHRIEQGGITVEISEDALDYLAAVGFDPQFGARPLKRVMQREILNELSKEIIAGEITTGDHVVIDIDGNKISFNTISRVEVVE